MVHHENQSHQRSLFCFGDDAGTPSKEVYSDDRRSSKHMGEVMSCMCVPLYIRRNVDDGPSSATNCGSGGPSSTNLYELSSCGMSEVADLIDDRPSPSITFETCFIKQYSFVDVPSADRSSEHLWTSENSIVFDHLFMGELAAGH